MPKRRYDSDTSFWKNVVVPTMKKLKGNKCQFCGSKEDLHVHHTTYKKVTLDTLRLLCRQCHRDAHLGLGFLFEKL